MQRFDYHITNNNEDCASIDDIHATINHVIKERRNRRYTVPNVNQLFVDVLFAPKGYDLNVTGVELTKGTVLPNIGYGKQIGILARCGNDFYICYRDGTSFPIPLGAAFWHLDKNTEIWIKSCIVYDMPNNVFRFLNSCEVVYDCYAKV